MTVRLSVIVLAILTAACGGGSAAAARSAETAAAKPVAVVRLARAPLFRTVTVTGTLAAEEQATLSLKVTGRLEELLVDLGSPVRKGQVLARLTPTDFELRLRQSEAALQQARARLGLDPTGLDDTIDITRTSLVRQA